MSDEFNILITKAKIKSLGFKVDDKGEMEWEIEIGLFTVYDDQISQVSLSSAAWQGKDKFPLPEQIQDQVNGIIKDISPVCSDKIMRRHKQLAQTIDI